MPVLRALGVDTRGVFLVLGYSCPQLDGCKFTFGTSVLHNDGTGWKSILTTQNAAQVSYAYFHDEKPILFDETHTFDPEIGFTFLRDPYFGLGGSVELGQRDYYRFVYGHTLKLDGDAWVEVGQFSSPNGVAAAAEGLDGTMSYVDGKALYVGAPAAEPQVVDGLPAGSYSGSPSAVSDSDFIIASDDGAFYHFQEGAFHLEGRISTTDTTPATLHRFEDRIYFVKGNTFGYIEDHEVHTLLEHPGMGRYLDIDQDGNVYLSLFALPVEGCGGHMVLWYDGKEFHPF